MDYTNIDTICNLLAGLIIAGGLCRIVYLLFMNMLNNDTAQDTKRRIRNILLAMILALCVNGIFQNIKIYFGN